MVTTAVAMAMEDTGEAITGMADTVDTTARGLLMPSPRLRLMPSPLLPLSPATATTVMATDTDTVTVTPAPTPTDTTATTARGPLMPSPAMATTAEGESSYSYWYFILSGIHTKTKKKSMQNSYLIAFGIAFIDQWFSDTAMEVTATDTAMAVDTDTTARGPLMPSPDMVTTAEGE